jgi:hypothetical protein
LAINVGSIAREAAGMARPTGKQQGIGILTWRTSLIAGIDINNLKETDICCSYLALRAFIETAPEAQLTSNFTLRAIM